MADPAPAAAPPLVFDAHAETLDHVVRAVVHSGFLEEATQLMLASPEHLHDPELLYRTRGVRGEDGTTLLMRAVERCDVARAAEILGACPTPATRGELLAFVNDAGMAALHLACDAARLDEEAVLRMVKLLLFNGADPLAPQRDPNNEDGVVWHAIYWAAQWSAQLVQQLVQGGASIDGDAEEGSTLYAAAVAGTAQGVRMIPQLVALGARETRGHETMLALARCPFAGAQPSDNEMATALNALVSVGCSLSEPDVDGLAPLDWATESGNAPMVRSLLSLGVPANGCSLARGVEHPELVRILLAAGAPIDAPADFDGFIRSPLMAAAYHSALESVEMLLVAGACVDLRNSSGNSALMWSLRGATFNSRIVEALLAAGADVNARNTDGRTALHYLAAFKAQQPWAADAARLLLQRGANARSVSSTGRTPAQLVPMAQRGGELHQQLLEAAAA